MSWEQRPLKDVGQWFGGGTPSKSRAEFWDNGSIPWLSPKDMGPAVLANTKDHITPAAVAGSAVRPVPANSVALVVRSGILERTLPVAIVPFETTLNQDMKAIAPNHDVDARWIAWGLRAFESQLLRTTRKAGTTVASIELPRLRAFQLPVPSLAEQRRIVEILEDHLSRLDAAAGYAAAASKRLIGLRGAALNSMLGTSDQRVSLGDLVIRIEAGKSFGGAAAPAPDGEWGIIKVSAMTWGDFRQDENKAIPAERVNPRYEIRPGDLLVSRANTAEYVGASVLVGDEVRSRLLLSDKSLRLIPRPGVDSSWLWRALQSPTARSQVSALATGTKDSMRNISQKALLQIQLPAVDLPTQREAVSRYSEIDASVRALHTELAQFRTRGVALRRAVLAAAFSAKLTGRHTDEGVIEEFADAPSSWSDTMVTA